MSYRQGEKGKENIVQTPQYQVLTQEGAEGSPSLKKTEAVLADRNAPRPYLADRHHPSLISSGNLLSSDVAVVSMVKKKHNFHVFLLIETVENNVCIIRQADFFLDQKQPAFKIGLFAKGQAFVLNEAFKAEPCLTWCEKMLQAIDIDLSEQQHWYDAIVAVPAWHFNEGVSSSEVASSSDSSCLVM